MLAVVAGFQHRLVAFEGGQAGKADDFVNLVGAEGFEQLDLFEKKTFEIDFAHDVPRV